jgi:hypothetical protein
MWTRRRAFRGDLPPVIVPVRYVSNIFKYYVAYSLEQETSERRRERKQAIGASEL